MDFDKERFLAHLEHFENPSAGEAANNVRAAVKMCKDANLHFVQTLKQVFGATNDAEINALKQRLQQREADAARISDAYDEAQERIEELETQQGRRLERESGLRGLVAHAWGRPDFRLALLAIVIEARFWLYAHYEAGRLGYLCRVSVCASGGMGLDDATAGAIVQWSPPTYEPLLANVLALVLGLTLFGKWNALEYQANGFGQLLMKWTFFIGGLVLVVLSFFGDWPWSGPWIGFGFRHARDVAHPLPITATLLMIFITLLAMSKFTRRLSHEVTALFTALFENPVLLAIKGWLV